VDNLESYYERLANWEGRPLAPLVALWNPDDAAAVCDDFQNAFVQSAFQRAPLTIPIGTHNQSIGNKVAEFLVDRLSQHLLLFQIEGCSGPGYPDKRLVSRTNPRSFPFELKATSHFNPTDTNRIVLTCSSEKLRRYFQSPVNHMLATACYNLTGNQIWIRKLRLDFLEPTTIVNVRLEASVSQKILSKGTHRNTCFEAGP